MKLGGDSSRMSMGAVGRLRLGVICATGRVGVLSVRSPFFVVPGGVGHGVSIVVSPGVVVRVGSWAFVFILVMRSSSRWLAAVVPSVVPVMISAVMIHPMERVGVVGVLS